MGNQYSAESTAQRAQAALDAFTSHGSQIAAAASLGISRGTLQQHLARAKMLKLEPQSQRLIGAEPAAAPPGYKLKGTSTYYNAEGVPTAQWVKTDAALEQLYAMQRAAVEALKGELPPLKKIAAPKHTADDLATLYTMTDCHVGMLAWDKETGADWDLSLAESQLCGTLLRMVASAPSSTLGILNQLGDFLHFDSLKPLTPEHGHILDADSRYQKMVEVAVRILRRIITAMLEKHAEVRIFMMEGNHDPAGSVWLRVLFAQLYADNPRVSVGMSPNPYVVCPWGKTLLGFYHGHLARLKDVPQIFAAQFRKEWGAAEYVYIHTGHKHHVEEKEHPGVKIIQHPTLAAPDAYAARGGWLSKRQATSMTYSKQTGEFCRGIFVP